MSRFDYVAYDEKAQGQQLEAKEQAIVLESLINGLKSPRARASAYRFLVLLNEVFYEVTSTSPCESLP